MRGGARGGVGWCGVSAGWVGNGFGLRTRVAVYSTNTDTTRKQTLNLQIASLNSKGYSMFPMFLL